MIFGYQGADTQKSMKTVPSKALKYQPQRGFTEEIYYMWKKDKRWAKDVMLSTKVPNLNVKADAQRIVTHVNYASTKGKWRGFNKPDYFAVRWSGFLFIREKGSYRFSLKSDDGSKLYLKDKYTVDNDGLHAMRQAESTTNLVRKYYKLILEYFQKIGHAGMIFRYMGPQTKSEMIAVPQNDMWAVYNKVTTPKVVKAVLPPKKVKKKQDQKKKADENQ